jgi:transposase
MRRHELEEHEWRLIKDLFPNPKGRGRPPANLRAVLNGIFWILRSGAPWRDLPERYGPWQTIYHWFNLWRKDGTVDRILERLQLRLDKDGYIDWDLWCVDGSHVRASRAAAGAGKKGGRKNPKTTHWVAREGGTGRRSTWSLTARAFPWQST